jgi:hypothetical protein
MDAKNELKKAQALKLIKDIFGNHLPPMEETIECLTSIREEIDALIIVCRDDEE